MLPNRIAESSPSRWTVPTGTALSGLFCLMVSSRLHRSLNLSCKLWQFRLILLSVFSGLFALSLPVPQRREQQIGDGDEGGPSAEPGVDQIGPLPQEVRHRIIYFACLQGARPQVPLVCRLWHQECIAELPWRAIASEEKGRLRALEARPGGLWLDRLIADKGWHTGQLRPLKIDFNVADTLIERTQKQLWSTDTHTACHFQSSMNYWGVRVRSRQQPNDTEEYRTVSLPRSIRFNEKNLYVEVENGLLGFNRQSGNSFPISTLFKEYHYQWDSNKNFVAILEESNGDDFRTQILRGFNSRESPPREIVAIAVGAPDRLILSGNLALLIFRNYLEAWNLSSGQHMYTKSNLWKDEVLCDVIATHELLIVKTFPAQGSRRTYSYTFLPEGAKIPSQGAAVSSR